MAFSSIAGSCSSYNVLFGAKEVDGNRASFGHYNGLRPVENMNVVSVGTKPSGFVPTSGNVIIKIVKNFLFFFLLSMKRDQFS